MKQEETGRRAPGKVPGDQASDLSPQRKKEARESLTWALILVKTSLQGNKALVTTGLSVTAARLAQAMTAASRRETGPWEHERMFCFFVWFAVSCQLIELCCELENEATKGLSGNVYNVELF